MELVKRGKTKDIYLNDDGSYTLRFKNTVTGHPGGEKDPGGNVVVGEVDGVAHNALKVTKYYFELLKKKGINSHYVSADLKQNELNVMPARVFGKGLEFVIRYVACGSFIKRFGDYCKEGEPLNVYEVTLKDDDRNDPPVTKNILCALNIMSDIEYDRAEELCKTICGMVKDDLKEKGLILYDIKLEFGLIGGEVSLIDEISAGNMRAFKDGKKLSYEELSNYF